MEFHPNITPIDVIKKGAFGGTYFRNIYSNLNKSDIKIVGGEFQELNKF